jgi:pimeloyl-ACP methyl ester carboxylesterase
MPLNPSTRDQPRMPSIPNSGPPDDAAPGTPDTCPPPLEWRSVLDEFRRLSRGFAVDSPDSGGIRGRTFGSGSPLYVLGPAAGDCELFALLAWLLKDDHCCVFVEPQPVSWPVRPLPELRRQTCALLRAADELGHERMSVLAVGAASIPALDLCLNAPGRIERLALLHGRARLATSWLENAICLYGSLLPGALRSVPGWRRVQQRIHRYWFPPFDAGRFDFLLETLGRTPTAQAARRLRLWSGLDYRPRLSALQLPVLLMHTEGEGRAIDADMQQLQSALPQAQVVDLHSTGLYPYLTHPHRVAKLIREFLQRSGP